MDRYVLVISICQTENDRAEEYKCLAKVKRIYDQIVDFTSQESASKISVLPVCSLSGCPSVQRWYFAVQACHGVMQFCSSDWEEVEVHQRGNSEEEKPTTLELCVDSLSLHDRSVQKCDEASPTELLEEAAEGVHALADKLPPPGKAFSDVLVLGSAEQCPELKDLLPLLGALRHMKCWHSARITIITENMTEWQKSASYLGAGLVDCTDLMSCINSRELWRGGLVVREKTYATELRFNGFSLCTPVYKSHHKEDPRSVADQKLHSEVFHYYAASLDLLHLITLSDLPSFQMSSTYFQLVLSGKSVKSKLFLDQLKSLRGKVGALFSLSCVVTPIAQPPASQITSQRWKESVARKPKSLPIPDIEVKGETANYYLLVQGSDSAEDGVCSVRLLHSDSQINGVPAMATVSGLLGQKLLSSSGCTQSNIFSLPCLQGDALLKREQRVVQVQTRVLREYFRQKEKSSSIPFSDLKAILVMAREQYLRMIDSTLPSAISMSDSPGTKDTVLKTMTAAPSIWPERNVLHNIENLQKRRQRRRLGLLGPGSSDNLLGPKDCQKSSTSLLDAKELLKHFTLDGKPTSELYLLPPIRGHNVFQLSPDLSPRRLSEMSFKKATASHYHGIEFCLDTQHSLDRDQAFVRLQSRLIRYETQTTCSKEPCVLPFVNSPAPSPAVMSEPGSVPDGETLQNADVARLKRRSWDTDVVGGYPCKRQAKSESSDFVCPQSNSSNGTPEAIKSLRQRHSTSQSVSSSTSSAHRKSSGLLNQSSGDKHKAPKRKTDHRQTEDKNAKESRSQKHNRMLQEVVVKTLKQHGISAEHKCFEASSKRLFDISKFFLKDLKTSRGLYDEMKKAAGSNAKQVIDWVMEKTLKN
ncbi:mdm2-binding protein isoform X1 [Corythoichthys intestinalis]|uniref:mdm2-binding protein isoform X1 n=1 Tax=Corythoichthys intestinalis TaxID=161448 RepID=UPI0025A565A0|nr:mdm2-binding protein isoform X1 [Corythoichthys intestinalis]